MWLHYASGHSYTSEAELFEAVRRKASELAKVDRGDTDKPGSGDPPGDWRLYFAMNGEISRKRPRGEVTSYAKNKGSGWLPAVPTTDEQRTASQDPAGAAAPDHGAAQAMDQTPCVRIEDTEWKFPADFFEESSFMESPFGRKLLGQAVEVHIREQFEPADSGLLSTDIKLLGPRVVWVGEGLDLGRPRKMMRGLGGSLRAADGWMSGIVTGWHDTRTNMVVSWDNRPDVPMQGPAKTIRDRPARYRVYHAWLDRSLWHNLDLSLYSLDPAAEVDHWRAYKRSDVYLVDHKSWVLNRRGWPPKKMDYLWDLLPRRWRVVVLPP